MIIQVLYAIFADIGSYRGKTVLVLDPRVTKNGF